MKSSALEALIHARRILLLFTTRGKSKKNQLQKIFPWTFIFQLARTQNTLFWTELKLELNLHLTTDVTCNPSLKGHSKVGQGQTGILIRAKSNSRNTEDHVTLVRDSPSLSSKRRKANQDKKFGDCGKRMLRKRFTDLSHQGLL